MEISRRLTTLLPDGDDGWGLYYRARSMQDAGRSVTMLTIGEHDGPTPAPILDAMDRSARAGETGYAPVPGSEPLRNAIAARVQARTGVPTLAENVLVTPGGQAALFAAHMAVLDPGDTALYVDPYYATYPGTLRAVGASPVPLVTSPDNGFRPDATALGALAPKARSLLINTPNNPTGRLYDRVTTARIAAACTEHDLWLVSDEVYDRQVWTGAHLSPRALPGMVERTLVVGSMSKTFAMTGSRIGWVVGPVPVIDALIDLATDTTYGVPGYIQAAALWALEQGSWLEDQVAEPFRRRRALAADALAGSEIVRPLPCEGAMFIMLDVRATGLSGTAFAESLLDAEGIAVMPGESFGTSASGHLRVAMTVADDTFADALSRLRRHAEHIAPSQAEHA